MARPIEHDKKIGDSLLNAAEALLAGGGIEAVSVRAVAGDIGTTTRAVYTVFGSKTGLLSALATRGYLLLAEKVAALPITDDPLADLVDVGVEGFRSFALESPHLFRLTFERIPTEVLADPEVSNAAATSYKELARRIERARDAGRLSGQPINEIAFAFHSLCQGMASGELSREPPPVGAKFWRPIHGLDAERLWRNALESLVSGLGRNS
ncbi:MAG: TetR/AcrR family transcriptional regulator [Wenzhouxiangellaceae bacterium]|nr:TetR/AcrR family transcriptional regulator [Wenzhouxiangellaceae bacterium]